MKKVIVVSKTHLDLGFTYYAESIRRKYIDTFIPEAIDLAERVLTAVPLKATLCQIPIPWKKSRTMTPFGKGKILEFDNRNESVKKDGISFVLENNVWGTNFPLWYEDNARFLFEIRMK